jgi:hypothetical protein
MCVAQGFVRVCRQGDALIGPCIMQNSKSDKIPAASRQPAAVTFDLLKATSNSKSPCN